MGEHLVLVFLRSYSRNSCVVKVLNPHVTQLLSSLPASQMMQIEALQRFQDEFNTLKSFEHLNLVRYIVSCNDPQIRPCPACDGTNGWQFDSICKKNVQILANIHIFAPDQLEPQYRFKFSDTSIPNTWYIEICAVAMFSCEWHHPWSHWSKSQILANGIACWSRWPQPVSDNSGTQKRIYHLRLIKLPLNEHDSSLGISFGVVMVQMVKNVSRITCSADLDL